MDNYTPKERLFFSRLKRKLLSHVILLRILLVGFLIGLFFVAFLILNRPLINITSRIFFIPRMTALFLFGSASSLVQSNQRTNILFLGSGGAGHEAPELTDTIIFVSLDHKLKNPVFLSLPRDIWIPSMRAKLNTAYYYGNQKREGGGIVLAKASVAEVLGQQVHYGAVLDFSGFVRLVDLLGGLTLSVDRSFDDYRYPIPGRENDNCGGDSEFKCRYEHVHFDQGKQVMNGERALKFVRSRNAEGEEGTDFARSVRQQKVILAIRGKLFSPNTILNPAKLKGMLDIVNDSIKTDIPTDKLPIFARMFLGLKQNEIKNVVLDGGTGDAQTGLLVNPPISQKYDNQWVLVPRDGTWSEVRQVVIDLVSQ